MKYREDGFEGTNRFRASDSRANGGGPTDHAEGAQSFADAVLGDAHRLGYLGTGWNFLFGRRRGWLRRLIEVHVRTNVAELKQEAHRRRTQLRKLIAAAPGKAQDDFDVAEAKDREAHDYRTEANAVRGRRDQAQSARASLPASQRGTARQGRETVVAVTGTVTMDAVTFLLTLAALGGALWLRMLIALVITCAYMGVIAVAGRFLATLWERTMQRPPLAILLSVVALVALGALTAISFVSMAEFRDQALRDLATGVPASPHFLLFAQSASALGATLSIAFWHHTSPGRALRDRVQELSAEIEHLERMASAAEHAATGAGNRARGLLERAESCKTELRELPEELRHRVEQERSEHEELLCRAEMAWEHGRQERERDGVRPSVPRHTQKRILDRLTELAREADTVPFRVYTNGAG